MHSSAPAAAETRRATILRHARGEFIAQGYAATRVEPIARAAAVSTATLYAFFDDKAGLFTAVIDDAAEDFSRQMQHVRTASGPASEQLTLFARTYAEFMGDPFVRSIFRLVMAERPRFQAVAIRFFEKGRQEFGAALIEVIRALCERGELACDKPSWAAGQLMGMIEHPVFFVPLVTGDEVQVRRDVACIAADAVETFLARYGALEGQG